MASLPTLPRHPMLAPSSSPSSEGREVGSRNGSPDTKLTLFSPLHHSSRSPGNLLHHNTQFSTPKSKTQLSGSDYTEYSLNSDQFLPTSSQPSDLGRSETARARTADKLSYLSPAASSFSPQVSPRMKYDGHFPAENDSLEDVYPSLRNLVLETQPDEPPSATLFRPTGLPWSSTSHSANTGPPESPAIDQNTTRYLLIRDLNGGLAIFSLQALFQEFNSVRQMVSEQSVDLESVFVGFWDIREAQQALVKIRFARPEWSVVFCPRSLYCKIISPEASVASNYEAQLNVLAEFSGHPDNFDSASVCELLIESFSSFGPMFDREVMPATSAGVLSLFVEFCDTRDAYRALSELHCRKVHNCFLIVKMNEPDLFEPLKMNRSFSTPISVANSPTSPTFPLKSRQTSLKGARLSLPLASQVHEQVRAVLSPTGRSIVYESDPQTPTSRQFYPSPQSRAPSPLENNRYLTQSPGPRGYMRTRQASERNGYHNVVDVERIRQGLDVRTTIMLRNIPNKIDQVMLKEIVDETSFGKYDFMYLRIDFANNCNVGYAFINFEDVSVWRKAMLTTKPYHIIEFVQARAGQRWNRFNSDKVAEVSYATIQGKDCLVQKFRNSSVMTEHPAFRPKIFYTGDEALAGQEEPFPGPDNPSKMKRSLENAEHVGLFAPRTVQHFRDERRERPSRYDRGNRFYKIEQSQGGAGQRSRDLKMHDDKEYHHMGPYAKLHQRPVFGEVGFRKHSLTTSQN